MFLFYDNMLYLLYIFCIGDKMAKFTEKEYREAAELWSKEHPNFKSVPRRAEVTISSGKVIPIGNRIRNMRINPDKLSEEKKEFWKDYGLFEEKRTGYSEEEYREAARIWFSFGRSSDGSTDSGRLYFTI